MVPSSCTEAYGPEEAWRCFFAQYAHEHVATPAIFHEYLYDSANLAYNGGSAAWAFAEDFRTRLTASLDGMPSRIGGGITSEMQWSATHQQLPAVFAPACELHEMIDSVLFTTSHVGNFMFWRVLGQWYETQEHNTTDVRIIDNVPGRRSTADCSGAAVMPKPPLDIPEVVAMPLL